jgi:DNA-binding XRE family transcriptional regulator
MAKPYRLLREKMAPERRARVDARVQEAIKTMALDELRAARDMTQEHLATILHVRQASISKMERRADMYISTLKSFIKAMGGQLEIRAVFPDGAVRIDQFSQLRPVMTSDEGKD